MTAFERIVVVGGSLAGLRAVEALRREGFTGRITLVGEEHHFPPYDRPPLSKEVLAGTWEPERARLRVDPDLEVDLELGVRAVSLDPVGRSVGLSSGASIGYDGLVVATGASPRRLDLVAPETSGVHVLRTIEDSLALGRALEDAAQVVVVGAGWIGAEVASAASARGRSVTVLEALDAPMLRALGPELGAWAADLQRAHGVDLRLGAQVEHVEVADGAVTGVRLRDGASIATTVLVVAVGVSPNTAWLQGAGLDLEGGVGCDATGRVIGAPDVVAVGDVARWYNPLFNRELRVEHWANAVEQADWAVRSLLHGPEATGPLSAVPYFWSDQFGTKIQYVGVAGTFAGVVEGSLGGERFVAIFESAGQLVGALCVNSPGRMIRYKRLIAEDVTPEAVATILPTTA